jgi:hypothetical protein
MGAPLQCASVIGRSCRTGWHMPLQCLLSNHRAFKAVDRNLTTAEHRSMEMSVVWIMPSTWTSQMLCYEVVHSQPSLSPLPAGSFNCLVGHQLHTICTSRGTHSAIAHMLTECMPEMACCSACLAHGLLCAVVHHHSVCFRSRQVGSTLSGTH